MGTLLSTPEGNGREIYGGQDRDMEVQQTTPKRKRRNKNGVVGARKRQKMDTSASEHFNDSIVGKDSSHANEDISSAVATVHIAENSPSRGETSKHTKKHRSRKSRKEQRHVSKSKNIIPILEASTKPLIPPKETKANSTIQSSCVLDGPLIETPPTKKRRKRAEPTSPYFPVPPTQLSSPPPTPTRKRSRRKTSPISKISIIEAPGVLPSLPHFRPTSENEFGLIQEKLRHEPWKMLVAVIFLNVTTAKMALPLLGRLFEQWPDAEALSKGNSTCIRA